MSETGVEISAVPPTVPEAPKVETPPVEIPKENAKFNELLKKEKMLYRTKQSLTQKEQAILVKEKALADKEAKLAAAQTNPLEALKYLGWTVDQINQFALENKIPVDKHVMDVRNELESFKKQQIEEKQKALEEAQKQASAETQIVIDNYREQIKEAIVKQPEKYELTNLYDDNFETVYEVISQHFASTNKVLSIEEAADLVEKYYEEEIEKGIKTKKLASRYPRPEPSGNEKKEAAGVEPRTLTNSMNSPAGPGLPPAKNEEDRMKRALAALDGKR